VWPRPCHHILSASAAARLYLRPHGRLQERVADEKGFLTDEGLEYTFARKLFPQQRFSLGYDEAALA
jgi:hypothetical protein